MQKELFEINTPETMGVTPRYVLQQNAISRSAHSLPATARKLTALAMALLPSDLSSLTASFTYSDFCKALGLEAGGNQYKIFREAVRECLKCVISLETEPDGKGKKKWKEFTWFTVAEFDEATGNAKMTFSCELAGFLKALKWMYSKISLSDIGQLQSRYAIRLFEIATSYKSMSGKQGNADQVWYFERAITELRTILGVPEDAYKENHLFKQKVIEGPVKEINKAGIGMKIQTTTVKQGRKLVALRFDCEKAPRTAKQKGRGKKAAAPMPENNPETEELRTEKELEHLKELYPAEFAELYEEELSTIPSSIPEGFKRLVAEGAALAQLKDRHGIVK
jgi:plasmid replication initiation protein